MQSFNPDAILFLLYVWFFRKELIIPKEKVKSLHDISPQKLKKKFTAVLFDKDNTLTIPYERKIHPSIKKSFQSFKKTFGKNIAIISNFAGSSDDKDYKDAEAVEKSLGIGVIRHKRKKPRCINDILKHFNCTPSEIVFIGDRLITDIAFGNKYGMHTILVEPFTEKGEKLMVKFMRKIEKIILSK